jgi:hypothetical protein
MRQRMATVATACAIFGTIYNHTERHALRGILADRSCSGGLVPLESRLGKKATRRLRIREDIDACSVSVWHVNIRLQQFDVLHGQIRALSSRFLHMNEGPCLSYEDHPPAFLFIP